MDLVRLQYMANQIAREFAPQGEAAAIAATAKHLGDFWDPRMKAAIIADANGNGGAALSPIARAAVERLKP